MTRRVENASPRDKTGSRSQIQGHCNNSGKKSSSLNQEPEAVVREVAGCSVGPTEDWTVGGR